MGVTAAFGVRMSDAKAQGLLHCAFRLGYHHFDTAEHKQVGNPFSRRLHEEIVGNFVQAYHRESYTVATKFTPSNYDEIDEDIIFDALDESLERLNLNQVDVYYLNAPSSLQEVKDFMEAAAKLVQESKISYVGLCDLNKPLDVEYIRAAHAIHPLSVVQQEWSVIKRDVEIDVIPVCVELDIGFVAFAPNARKLFAPGRGNQAEAKRNTAIKAILNDAASTNREGSSAHQMAIAWVYQRARQLGVTVLAIPGTSKAIHAQANFRAAGLTLTEAQMKALQDVWTDGESQ
jgi:aryl-alcohol dehydrogenase-like predicted oxidoreductase